MAEPDADNGTNVVEGPYTNQMTKLRRQNPRYEDSLILGLLLDYSGNARPVQQILTVSEVNHVLERGQNNSLVLHVLAVL